jgi:hypothetical protein
MASMATALPRKRLRRASPYRLGILIHRAGLGSVAFTATSAGAVAGTILANTARLLVIVIVIRWGRPRTGRMQRQGRAQRGGGSHQGGRRQPAGFSQVHDVSEAVNPSAGPTRLGEGRS